MKPISVLVTSAKGTVLGSNLAARESLGSAECSQCSDVVRARGLDGERICNRDCAESLAVGSQVDHGVVRIRGAATRMVCSSAGDHHVVVLSPAPEVEPGCAKLSPREIEVLSLVARGFTTHRIARRLAISPSTARTHVEHIRDKLGVRTRSQAVAKALALGQIE